MECFLLFLFLIAALILAAGMTAGRRARSRRLRRIYSRLVQQYGGMVRAGGWFSDWRLMFVYRDVRLTLRTHTERAVTYSQLEGDWPDTRFRLELAPRCTQDTPNSQWGLHEVRSGSHSFDSRFLAMGVIPEDARAFLSHGVQWQTEQLHELQDGSPILVRAERGRLIIRKLATLRQYEDLQRFAELSLALYDQALLTRAAGIQFVDDDAAQLVTDAKCQVCGEEIEQQMVVCRRCKTPHHQDCWQYTGGCSVYGCRETKYVMPGNPKSGRREFFRRKR